MATAAVRSKPAAASRARARLPLVKAPIAAVAQWTFLTNHAHVLVCIAQDDNARMRDIAQRVGITERAVQRIVHELEQSGYVAHEREGRRNSYRVNKAGPLRHPVESHRTVAALLLLAGVR
jgi:predicted transcriptional regulator